jgi:5-methyltetrahydrofolate--homocysteine methyltransferase
MRKAFDERLQAGEVFVADGAAGTMLQAMGLESGQASERWNIEQPPKILALHRGYLDAGSEIILTNSFGGTRFLLAKHGLTEKLHDLNLASARLARQAANERDAFVAGDIGPSGELLKPLGTLTYDDAVAAFAEQAAALAEGGIDFFLVETMSDLNELKAAVEGARQADANLPIVATMSFDTHGRTMMGVTPAQAARTIAALGVLALGANCGSDLGDNEKAIAEIRAAEPTAILWAKPNAGLPKMVAGRTIYDVTPETMAESARRLVALGAQVVGGCCGSTPTHIAAIATALGKKRF